HDGFEAGVAQRERRVAAAIVELDTLADAVRPAAENYDLLARARRRLVGGAPIERRLVGAVHVSGGRGELGGAWVDAFECGTHAERAPSRRDFAGGLPGELREARIGEAHGLEPPQRRAALRQTLRPDFRLRVDDAADLREEPRVDAA